MKQWRSTEAEKVGLNYLSVMPRLVSEPEEQPLHTNVWLPEQYVIKVKRAVEA